MSFNYYDNGQRGGFLSSLPTVTKNLIIIKKGDVSSVFR